MALDEAAQVEAAGADFGRWHCYFRSASDSAGPAARSAGDGADGNARPAGMGSGGVLTADFAVQIHQRQSDVESRSSLAGHPGSQFGDRWLRTADPLGDPDLRPAGRLKFSNHGLEVHDASISASRLVCNRQTDAFLYQTLAPEYRFAY